ncbi:MAG: extracellular solute-binding protein [Treponema sp.]|jgi:putative aldouronate transport system substrate-binding protein|nr:extracellular solute-binding protein [Treponema sp.]
MKKIGFLTALCLGIVGLVLFTGCKGSEKSDGASAAPTGKIDYPVKTDATLRYWGEMSNSVAANFTNLGETSYGKAWQEKTGIKVEFLHPPAGGANEQFNLLVASNEMPDIMDRDWLNTYPGGPQKAIEDGVIIRLNDIIDKYAPNLKAALAVHPEWDRMVKTDKGDYYAFPFLRGDEILCIYRGPMIRKDWLDDLNLSVPETYDEWYTALKAFKTQKGAAAPLSMISITAINIDFMFGYGIDRNFYVGDDGKAHYGSAEEAFRDYLAMMNQWYKEGLLDPDFATVTIQQVTAKMTSGVTGASCGGLGGQMGTWTNTARASDPGFELTAAPYPVRNKGDKPTMIFVDNAYSGPFSAAITSSCKNPELAARLLDWNYGPEGTLFNNFGVEGVSYTMIDGKPIYTDLIMKNPNGWSLAQSIGAYARAAYGGPFIQNLGYFEQYMALPEQKNGPRIWKIDDPYKHKMPPITPTSEESSELGRIMSEVTTYADEMLVKFVLGTEPLSNWDNYVTTIKKMGINRAVEIQNAALTRFKTR